MRKRHDLNKRLHNFGKVGRVDLSNHSLKAPRTAVIGIKMRGKIDYLTHYKGWHFILKNVK